MILKNTSFAPSKLGLDVPLCYLTTTGRLSGEFRTVPLLYAQHDDGRAVVATNWGTAKHPAWSHNLEAEPSAALEVAGTLTDVMAHRLTDHEAVPVWQQMETIWPGYEKYREIAPRDVRVYVLKPA